MAREERDQRRRAFGTEAADGSRIEALPEEPTSTAEPLEDGAHRRLSRGQVIGLAFLAATLLLLTVSWRQPMLEGLHVLFFVGFLGHSAIKLVAASRPGRQRWRRPSPTRPCPATRSSRRSIAKRRWRPSWSPTWPAWTIRAIACRC